MTRQEIVQALRCCADHSCSAKCPAFSAGLDCREEMHKEALALLERLTAENAALEPEAVETVKLALAAKHMVDLETLNNTPISRLVELAEADKDGRVVVLPCRQGDELWTYCNHPVKRVYSFTVSDVSTLNGRTVLNTLGLGTIRPEDIGKTVFLTREEAERAMQEMEGKKDG
nr:MAG TPA: hypothetical protein [Caudoviricetes sp.]